MPGGLDSKRLGLVFQSRPDILAGIQQAADSPARVALFNEIATFVHDTLLSASSAEATSGEPLAKRRKVENNNGVVAAVGVNGHAPPPPHGLSGGAGGADTAAVDDPVLLEIKEISLSIPQRKKYDLCFTKNFLYARLPGASGPAPGIVYPWKEIEYTFLLPVPEKTQPQFNFVLLPKGTALASASKSTAPAEIEPLVFTVPATAPKAGTIAGPASTTAASVSDSYTDLFSWALKKWLLDAGNNNNNDNTSSAQLTSTDPRVFHSVVRQPHRPSEKAVHVKAFRGSKDGFLFFLPTGIFWGFKKPLLFIPLDRVIAVSYTNVLQRTFNVVVEVDLASGSGDANANDDDDNNKTEEIEFAMLDQEDYGGIDESYVRRHGLQDRSMAERRKAKRELAENNKNGARGGGGGGDGDADGGDQAEGREEDDGLTELQRAEKQLQDEEDDLEEDYDPDADEGSESGSEEDEEEGVEEEEGEGELDEEDEEEE